MRGRLASRRAAGSFAVMKAHRWVTLWLLAAASLSADGIDDRIETLQPTAEERKIDQIGWAGSISEALTLAREHRRPVFLFTHDGRMARGRC